MWSGLHQSNYSELSSSQPKLHTNLILPYTLELVLTQKLYWIVCQEDSIPLQQKETYKIPVAGR